MLMKNLFFLSVALVLILGVLPNYSSKENIYENIILDNGCMIYSIRHQYALEAQNILKDANVWAKVVIFKTDNSKVGHAITVYIYKNCTYVYDSAYASYQIAEYPIYDPRKIVEIIRPMDQVLWAEYVENVMGYNYVNFF